VLGQVIVNLIWRKPGDDTGCSRMDVDYGKAAVFRAGAGYAMPYDARSTSPRVPSFPADTLAAAGLSNDDVVKITDIWTAITIPMPGSCRSSALVCILNRPNRHR